MEDKIIKTKEVRARVTDKLKKDLATKENEILRFFLKNLCGLCGKKKKIIQCFG